ncbi:MAG TPA: bacterial transcriptional activator domain-containing protein, partial [Oscillatoriaceae cyanobacterium]
ATVTELDRLEARLHATRARLYLAAARSEAGETEAAREALAAAEAAIQTHGYGFLRGEDSALWAELQALAVEPLQLVHRVPAAGFELTLLGGFEVRSGGLRIEHWPRRKSRLVLAALALYPRGLRPAELAELCGEPGMTLATLQRNVSGIRQALEAAGDSATLVVLEDDRYRLDGARVAGVDVWTLEAAIAEARQTSAENAEAAYTRALGLYRAPLWEDGPAEACFVAERERLRALALGAARWLESRRRTAGDWEGALAMLERAVAIAPTDEELYLALIAHHRAAGQLERARQAYWDCRKALKLHLGLEPGEAIEAAHSNLENRSARTR